MNSGWTVTFYRDARGVAPVEQWINTLHDPKGILRARIDALLLRLRDGRGRLPEPYAKHLVGKLWELRWHISGAHLRVIYATVNGRILLLLSGFTKKAARTPRGEIVLAQRRLDEWSDNQ
jgi:phage-related protein